MNIGSFPARVFAFAKEIAYPSTCAFCDRRGVWLCDECALDWVPMMPALCCDRCGHPILGKRCACRTMHPAVGKARAVAAYDGWPERSLHRLKYDRERDRARFIAERMATLLESLAPADVLIPVPLHDTRQQDRGFNQSELIASDLSAICGIPVEHALVRVKPTASQTRLNREQRIANMDGAMVIAPEWLPDPTKHYVLVDDVYTTGTTTGACAEQLAHVGIEKLSALTFMFDIQPRDLENYRRVVIAAGL